MKNRRAIMVGFNEQQLAAFAGEGLEPVCHIGSEPASSLPGCQFIAARSYVRYEMPKSEPRSIPTEKWQAAREKYLDYFIRCADRYANSSALLNDWTDYDMLFMTALEQARDLIEKHQPDCLLFVNYPHRCATVALFAWAQVCAIPSVLSFQSQWPNMMLLLSHWEDMGRFESAVLDEAKPIDISPPRSMPFYMNRINSPGAKVRRSVLKFAEFSARLLAWPFLLLGDGGEWRINRILDELRNSAQGIALSRNRRLAPPVPLEKLPERFVFFPLHLQPEMNTDIMGGAWANQMLALQRLRSFVPPEIPIVVKENPKQTGLVRSRLFWQRMAAIPNLMMTDDSVSSLELVKRAELTATITGTAGWEALRFGRPALAFGHVFWSSLPGAFQIGNATWNDVETFRFDAELMAQGVEKISRIAWYGVTDRDYIPIVQDFDPAKNAVQVAKSFRAYLDRALP